MSRKPRRVSAETIKAKADKAEKVSRGEKVEEAPKPIDPPLVPASVLKRTGRPSKYDPTFCERVVELGAEGKSRTQIAAILGVSKTTLGAWEDQHPAFLSALKEAKDLEQAWWEDAGQIMMMSKSSNAVLFIFQMKNRFKADYRDVQVNELTGKDGGPIETATKPEATGTDHLEDLTKRYATKTAQLMKSAPAKH